MSERLRVREIDDDEGRRLVRIIRRGGGSMVTWRRAQMVLLSARGMDVPAIAKGGVHQRGPEFTLVQRREIKKIAKSRPAQHDLPFSAWSLVKLADFLVAEGGDDISHEGPRVLLRQEGVTFQCLKTAV